ncbi:MAG: yufP [Bacillales bacterium]|jgi:simple sugar transport system permease protein|nr:yufP [Bacillales bacterium]
MNSTLKSILVPIVAILLGFLVGGIIMILCGYDAILGYQSLFNGIFSNSYFMGESIVKITPLILSGLAVAFAFRTGLFNIGVEGQFIVGWTAAVYVGTHFEGLSKVVHLPLAILAAAVGGALWALLPGILKAYLRVHEVVVTIMMNYIALHVTNWFIQEKMAAGGGTNTSERVFQTASLSWKQFSDWTAFSRLHWGILVALIAALIYWFILEKSKVGYELRSVGFNHHASQYAGMNVSKNIILAMLISGAFAGVAGAMEGLGTFQYAAVKGGFTGVGFTGIATAFIGANTALGVVLASFLFGGLQFGSLNMPYNSQVPTELVAVVIALIIYFIASNYSIRTLLDKIFTKGAK